MLNLNICSDVYPFKYPLLVQTKEIANEIVKELYQEKRVAKLISEALPLTFKDFVDKDVLRKYLSENSKDIKILNSIIHPLVKERILAYYNNSKSKIVIAEVPLLFEAKMEKYFDY